MINKRQPIFTIKAPYHSVLAVVHSTATPSINRVQSGRVGEGQSGAIKTVNHSNIDFLSLDDVRY